MQLVVFSDPHSNLEALQAFLKDIQCEPYDKIICLGDVSGYNANPNECIKLIKSLDIPCIKGNHDDAISKNIVPWDFNYIAQEAVKWHIKHVTKSNKTWLKNLPDVLFENTALGKAIFVHGSPVEQFDYIWHNQHARVALSYMRVHDLDLCFVGHSHVPGAFVYRNDKNRPVEEKEKQMGSYSLLKSKELDEIENVYVGDVARIGKHDRAIINVGSVGQPRDKHVEGCYVIMDDEKGRIEYYRFTYDFNLTAKKIIEVGLPRHLAERLQSGN